MGRQRHGCFGGGPVWRDHLDAEGRIPSVGATRSRFWRLVWLSRASSSWVNSSRRSLPTAAPTSAGAFSSAQLRSPALGLRTFGPMTAKNIRKLPLEMRKVTPTGAGPLPERIFLARSRSRDRAPPVPQGACKFGLESIVSTASGPIGPDGAALAQGGEPRHAPYAGTGLSPLHVAATTI